MEDKLDLFYNGQGEKQWKDEKVNTMYRAAFTLLCFGLKKPPNFPYMRIKNPKKAATNHNFCIFGIHQYCLFSIW
jgi:hypothetical protein